MAQKTIATLQTLRDEAKFDLFWERLLAQQSSLYVDAPELPRRRKQPQRFELGIAKAEFCEDVKAMYRQQYYEALDFIISSITAWFDQPGFKMYRNLQELLLKALPGEDWDDLRLQLQTFMVKICM